MEHNVDTGSNFINVCMCVNTDNLQLTNVQISQTLFIWGFQNWMKFDPLHLFLAVHNMAWSHPLCCFKILKNSWGEFGWLMHTKRESYSTFTAIICPLGICRIISTTPYAPRPNSDIGSRSSAFTSKFYEEIKSRKQNRSEKADLHSNSSKVGKLFNSIFSWTLFS